MGDHLLNGVKCVREVHGLTNALIISPSLFLDRGGQRRRGNDRRQTGIINYHSGAPGRTRSRLSPTLQLRRFSMPNHGGNIGIFKGAVIPRQLKAFRFKRAGLTRSTPSASRRP